MIYQGKDFTISYNVKGNKKNQAIILFPPGIGFSSSLSDLAKILSKKYFVISPDMPGVNKSFSKKADLDTLSEVFKEFIDGLEIKNPILFGYSYGGCVAVKLSQKIKTKKLVLIGVGEYFNFILKIIFSILFFPARYFVFIGKLYAKILPYVSIFNFDGFSDNQLKLINDRWLAIIWFTLPGVKNNVKTLLIYSKKDNVCSFRNYDKMKKLFPNSKLELIEAKHGVYMEVLKKNNYHYIMKFLD